jgi:adenylate cyclase
MGAGRQSSMESGTDMPIRQRLALGLAAAALIAALSLTPPWEWFGGKVFDYLSSLAPPQSDGAGPIVVAIDEPSLAYFGQWPWPRSRHADLVRALRAAGAKTIVLDLLFSEPGADPAADADLAAAMGPDVVLAADEVHFVDRQADRIQRDLPLPALTDGGKAHYGFVGMMLEPDGVLRRLPQAPADAAPGETTLAEQVLVAGGIEYRRPGPDALIQYFGPARTYQTYSYDQALDPLHMLPPGTFKDRIVIVGFSQQTQADLRTKRPDTFATAFTIRNGHLTFGPEVNATLIDNLRLGLFISPAPGWTVLAVTLLVAMFTAQGLRRYDPLRSAPWTAIGLAALVVGSFALLRLGRVWITPTTPAAVLLLVAIARTALGFLDERARRRWITGAMGHYVSPAMVEQLVAEPGRLRLGGELRELSILFCDLRGFTSISEAMQSDPAKLTAMINRIMDALTDCVLAEGGTIDKYIGDCVMAFWNAPLADPDHALHAVRAGAAMVARIDMLAAELEREGLPRIAVGVGINTGHCIVGNLGSRHRFDYSALGDAVNLASRLESASKELRVPIVIGPETASQIGDRIPLRPLGVIRVKGKAEEIAVSTLAG